MKETSTYMTLLENKIVELYKSSFRQCIVFQSEIDLLCDI